MPEVLYKMVGFDPERAFPGQGDWIDIVYAGEDGSILVLLGRDYTPQKPRTIQKHEEHIWLEATKGEGGDWFRMRQTKDNSNNRWYVTIRPKGKHKTYVHHLVLWAWRGPIPGCGRIRPDVGRHLNDTSGDNNRRNLEWGSKRDDRADRENPRNRERAKQCNELLSGVKIILECDKANWKAEVSRYGVPMPLVARSRINSKRKTNVQAVLRHAIDSILDPEIIQFTTEKWPKHFEGHRPWCSDCNFWLPNDFTWPDENYKEFTEERGTNRCKEVRIGGVSGIVYEFILKTE